jgi:hypothetical protein
VCTGAGPEECKMVKETFCSTRYREAEGRAGHHVGDTRCEKVGHLVCGKGCSYKEEPEICHEDRIGMSGALIQFEFILIQIELNFFYSYLKKIFTAVLIPCKYIGLIMVL